MFSSANSLDSIAVILAIFRAQPVNQHAHQRLDCILTRPLSCLDGVSLYTLLNQVYPILQAIPSGPQVFEATVVAETQVSQRIELRLSMELLTRKEQIPLPGGLYNPPPLSSAMTPHVLGSNRSYTVESPPILLYDLAGLPLRRQDSN